MLWAVLWFSTAASQKLRRLSVRNSLLLCVLVLPVGAPLGALAWTLHVVTGHGSVSGALRLPGDCSTRKPM